MGVGLYVTWPTSYEALVGRAELKPGACMLLYPASAWQAETYSTTAGEWVLVTASAGGVGIAAVQLAKGASSPVPPPSLHALVPTSLALTYASHAALGAKVIAAAGSQEKLDVSIRLGGADYGVNYSKEGWQKEVLKITGGKGVDVIYDPVGLIRGMCSILSPPVPVDSMLSHGRVDSLKCIAWKGRAIVVGFAAGQIEKVMYPYACKETKH